MKPPSSTPGDLRLPEFVESLRQADLSPATVRGYRLDTEAFRRWLHEVKGPEPSLERLTAIDLMNYRQHLVDVKRLKPATVNRRIEALRRLCRWAHRQGIAKSDIAQEIKAVRAVPRRRPLGLLTPEVHALLRAAGETRHGLAKRNYALLQVMIQAGPRVSEVASLRVADVVLRDRVGTVRIRQGKGRKEREVPLNATARRALRTYLETRGSLRPEESLFASGRQAPLSARAIQSVISHLAHRAKIERVRVSAHTLRHTFALNYLKQNPGKLVELASLLGHDSLDTTAIYTRPSQEDLAEDLERSPLNVYG